MEELAKAIDALESEKANITELTDPNNSDTWAEWMEVTQAYDTAIVQCHSALMTLRRAVQAFEDRQIGI